MSFLGACPPAQINSRGNASRKGLRPWPVKPLMYAVARAYCGYESSTSANSRRSRALSGSKSKCFPRWLVAACQKARERANSSPGQTSNAGWLNSASQRSCFKRQKTSEALCSYLRGRRSLRGIAAGNPENQKFNKNIKNVFNDSDSVISQQFHCRGTISSTKEETVRNPLLIFSATRPVDVAHRRHVWD